MVKILQNRPKIINFWKFWQNPSGDDNIKLVDFEVSPGVPRENVKIHHFLSKMTIFGSFLGSFLTPNFLPPNQRFWGPKRSFFTLQPSHFRRENVENRHFGHFLSIFDTQKHYLGDGLSVMDNLEMTELLVYTRV